MTVLIDACVLYPTVLRRLVIGAARTGVFTPMWSPRILEEWARAAARDGYDAEARAEIAKLRSEFPDAEVTPDAATEAELSLPDADDVHVLAAAIIGGAKELLTLNTKDFPTRTLAAYGIIRRHPDEFLLEAFHAGEAFQSVITEVYAQALTDGIDMSLRGLLKKSRLPRLGKVVAEL